MLSKELLDDLRNRVIDDPGLEALLIAYDAMYHDLATSEGLWCIDHKPEGEPHAFRLHHSSIHPQKSGLLDHATFHEYGQITQDESRWRGWYEDENGVCVGFERADGKRVAFNAETDMVTPL